MIFERTVRIPAARVAVLIGRHGSTKAAIEKACSVSLDIDSADGSVTVASRGGAGGGRERGAARTAGPGPGPTPVPDAAAAAGTAPAPAAAAAPDPGGNGEAGGPDPIDPFKAADIVLAIGRGFAPDRAMSLLGDDRALHVIDLREFAGKSPSQIERIKGRIIGERGRARRSMESLTGASISVYGRTVAVIGSTASLRMAVDAISSLSSGSMHGAVYGRLEAARRRQKAERMILWEGQNVF